MSYKTYTTEAIVCGSRANNTSDKAFLLFTRDAGMLWATARSVREERSKQRFALQDFSLTRVSLVRGKSGWRVGSAESTRNFFTESTSQSSRAATAGVIKLLRQFVRGEVAHVEVFEDVKAALLVNLKIGEEIQKIPGLFGFRLLYRLGYIPKREEYADILDRQDWWDLPPLSERQSNLLENAKEVSHL